MGYEATFYKGAKGYETRVTATNGRIIGTSGVQGYLRKRAAARVARRILLEGPHQAFDAFGELPKGKENVACSRRYYGEVYMRVDGHYDWRIVSRRFKRRIVLVSHNQGYSSATDAFNTLVKVCYGTDHSGVV